MHSDTPKQYLPVAGKPMLQHALETFTRSEAIAHIFVVVNRDDGYIDDVLARLPLGRQRISVVRNGGASRQQSVLNGLAAMRGEIGDDDWVLVHDAARPGLNQTLIERLIDAVGTDAVGGLLALPVVDTIKRSNADGRAEATVPRDALWAAQTPQMFAYARLQQALASAAAVTDEASAIEMTGLRPMLVEGDARNFKVTSPQDIALAEMYLKGSA